jgi:MYXO-CTERM domain-containing protein
MMRLRVLVLGGLAAACATISFAERAAATPNFPGAIASKLAGETPDCSICHVCRRTMRGTVNTPWGAAMRERGLQAYDESSLMAALERMRADGIDSDGDGTLDVDAVKMGKDPNPPTCDEEADETIPKYGCVGSVSASGEPANGGVVLLALALLGVAATVRRRKIPAASAGVAIVIASTGLMGACGLPRSGAALAPRGEATRETAPRMMTTAPSTMANELRAVGLDPENLPPFAELTPRQLHRVMSTFTRSLGFACTDCHDPNDHRVPTRMKAITVQMWNEFTRPYVMEGRGAAYCDSCHQGQARFLERSDRKKVAAFMADNFTALLARRDKKDVECETCHGEPFEARLLPRSAAAK